MTVLTVITYVPGQKFAVQLFFRGQLKTAFDSTGVIGPRLARFMREVVNVPFSIAVLEHDGARRPVRYRGAALVLHGAVRDLARWQAPPAVSPEGRAVFYTYARHLERQVARLERETRDPDPVETGARLDAIRQTCDGCHRFFRPPSAIAAPRWRR